MMEQGQHARRCRRCRPWIVCVLLCTLAVEIDGVLGCDDPGPLANGVRDPPAGETPGGTLPLSTQVHFSCNEGYLLDGPPKIICTKENKWLPADIPACIAMYPCSHTPCQNGATCVDTAATTPGYRCHCPPAFHGDQCEQRLDCALPPDGEVPHSHYAVHGRASDQEGWYLPGTTLVYQCDAGYVMHGDRLNRQCQGGRWVGRVPKCVEQVLCADPGQLENGQRCCQNVFYSGFRLSFYCDEGYQMNGSDERICQDDGQWTGVQPVCVKAVTEPTPPSNDMFNTKTLTVVTATTGSILGILVVTVILTSRQCRSNRHHSNPISPPVLRTRIARLRNDLDATALVAVAEDIDVVLPSYDEATSPLQPPTAPPFGAIHRGGTDSTEGGDEENRLSVQGRPLPPIPPPPSHGSRRARRRQQQQRSPSTAQAAVPPPPYTEHSDLLDVADAQPGARGEDTTENHAETAEEPEVAHSMVGNDLYAEVPQRRAERQGDGAQDSQDTDEGPESSP